MIRLLEEHVVSSDKALLLSTNEGWSFLSAFTMGFKCTFAYMYEYTQGNSDSAF